MADKGWTQAEELMLVAGFQAGIALPHIGQALRRPPGSVRWKLTALGLVRLPSGPPGAAHPQYERQDEHGRRGDLAFKRAMLRAIDAGAERARPGVIKSRSARYVRRIIPAVESGYRSSAGYTADMGVDRGGPNGSAHDAGTPPPDEGARKKPTRRGRR